MIRMAKVGNGSRRLAEATCGPIQIQPCYVAHVSLLSAFLGCFTDQCLIHSMQLLYEIANILFYSIEGCFEYKSASDIGMGSLNQLKPVSNTG